MKIDIDPTPGIATDTERKIPPLDKIISSTMGERYRSMTRENQVRENMIFWKVVSAQPLERSNLGQYFPHFGEWVSQGLVQELSQEDVELGESDQLAVETIRRLVYHSLFKAIDFNHQLASEQIDAIRDFLESLVEYIPKEFNPLTKLSYDDRVPITMALLAKKALGERRTEFEVLPNFSLAERAVAQLYQHGWKYGLSLSSRSISMFLAKRIRDGDMFTQIELLRSDNLRNVLSAVDDYGFAGRLAASDLQEINRLLTIGTVPAGSEGDFRNYEGQMNTNSKKCFIPSSEIKPMVSDLFRETRDSLNRINSLFPEETEEKHRFVLNLSAYLCARINEIKAFLEGNGRLGYVMAEWVLRRANSPDTFVFPGIFNERRDPDYLEYYRAVAEAIESDQPLHFEQTQRLQLLVNFIGKHLKKREIKDKISF